MTDTITLGCYTKTIDNEENFIFLGFRILKRITKFASINGVTISSIERILKQETDSHKNSVFEATVRVSGSVPTIVSITDLNKAPKKKYITLGSASSVSELDELLKNWASDDRNTELSSTITINIPPIGEGDYGANIEIDADDYTLGTDDIDSENYLSTIEDYLKELYPNEFQNGMTEQRILEIIKKKFENISH